MEKYENLFEEITQNLSDSSPDAIQLIKESYKGKVLSKRDLELVTDVKSIILLLDKQGIIDNSNVKELKEINNKFYKNTTVKELIDEYEAWLKKSPQLHHRFINGKIYIITINFEYFFSIQL